jgi:hypothetical protein
MHNVDTKVSNGKNCIKKGKSGEINMHIRMAALVCFDSR